MPLIGKVEFEYDINGNLLKVKDFEGNITDYEYDSSNNLIKISFPNQTTMKFCYDSLGKITKEER